MLNVVEAREGRGERAAVDKIELIIEIKNFLKVIEPVAEVTVLEDDHAGAAKEKVGQEAEKESILGEEFFVAVEKAGENFIEKGIEGKAPCNVVARGDARIFGAEEVQGNFRRVFQGLEEREGGRLEPAENCAQMRGQEENGGRTWGGHGSKYRIAFLREELKTAGETL